MLRQICGSWARFAFPVLGLTLGVVVVKTSPYQPYPLWLVWAPLAVALSTAAGAVLTYGCRCWCDLRTLSRCTVSWRDVAKPIGLLVVVAMVIIYVPPLLFPKAAWGNLPSGPLTGLATLAGAPAAGVMYGVRHAARSKLSDTAGGRVDLLIALRRLVERLLPAVGSLLALNTLQFGALLTLARSAHPLAVNRPPEYVLIYGGVGSLLLGLVYVPAWAALQHRGLRLSDGLFPIQELNEPAAVLSGASDRQKLEQILGADHSVLADMQAGIAILAPLLASAAAAFLPH